MIKHAIARISWINFPLFSRCQRARVEALRKLSAELTEEGEQGPKLEEVFWNWLLIWIAKRAKPSMNLEKERRATTEGTS